MTPINLRPSALRQFENPAETFCLVTDKGLSSLFTLSADDPNQKNMVVTIDSGDDLGKVLRADVPSCADVLVICRQTFVSSPDEAAIGPDRRVVVMPCASTPVSAEHIQYFLRVAERIDPHAQARRAEEFFRLLSSSPGVRIADKRLDTACEFDPFGDEYDWNQQAGPLLPGEQQITPSGELSVLPMEITDFDSRRTLSLNGTLAVCGWPIVHAGYDQGLADAQKRLYEKLLPLHRNPILLRVSDGIIIDVRDPARTDEGAVLEAALEDLFADDPRYRTIWELGFGINTDMTVVPANCGLNEPYGAGNGVIHIGLGLTPYTQFALTFLCPSLAIVDEGERTLLGKRDQPDRERVIRPIRRAGCGCQIDSTGKG
jgi:hypothetical protein